MILAIDPGPLQSAYVIWYGRSHAGVGIVSNFEICHMIHANYDISLVACEHIQNMGMPVGATTHETSYWIGEFRCETRKRKLEFVRVFRSQIKMHFCNSMRAKDPNIRQALIDRLGAPGTKKNPGPTYGIKSHLWSALAIAIFTSDQYGSP